MSSRHDPSSPRSLDAVELHRRLAPVLADLAFPAARWQALTAGDLYGCDSVTRTLLERLPERRYGGFTELVGILAAVLAGHHVPAAERPAGPAPVRPGARPPRAGASGAGGPRTAPTTRIAGTTAPGRPQPAA